MLDHPLSVTIEELRRKEREGLLTTEDMKEVVRLYRDKRFAAAQSSAASRKKQEASIDSDALLNEMGEI